MQYHIETERLLLKPVAPEDVSAMFIWTSDPEVNPYLSYPLHHDVSVMQKEMDRISPSGESGIRILPQRGQPVDRHGRYR